MDASKKDAIVVGFFRWNLMFWFWAFCVTVGWGIGVAIR